MLLLKLFWELCIFRKAPQDIPYSHDLLFILVILRIITDTLLNMLYRPLWEAIFIALSIVFIIYIFTYILLFLLNYSNRFIQTYTALIGTDILISIVFLFPLILLSKLDILTDISNFSLFAGLWSIAVTGHIFRYAFSISIFTGIVLALCYVLIIEYLLNIAFGN